MFFQYLHVHSQNQYISLDAYPVLSACTCAHTYLYRFIYMDMHISFFDVSLVMLVCAHPKIYLQGQKYINWKCRVAVLDATMPILLGVVSTTPRKR